MANLHCRSPPGVAFTPRKSAAPTPAPPLSFTHYSLAFWYGAQLVRDDEIEGGDILIALFATMIGFFGIGQGLS
jgi:hypothetical protein